MTEDESWEYAAWLRSTDWEYGYSFVYVYASQIHCGRPSTIARYGSLSNFRKGTGFWTRVRMSR